MLRLPVAIDQGVDTACGSNCHCICLSCFFAAPFRSGCEMIARVSGFGMGVGRFSRPLRGVGVLAMPDVGLHTMGCVKSVCEDSLGAGVL
jgi:hypothetical protein